MSRIQSLFMKQQESESFQRYLAENEPMEYPPEYCKRLNVKPPLDYAETSEYLKFLEEKTNDR